MKHSRIFLHRMHAGIVLLQQLAKLEEGLVRRAQRVEQLCAGSRVAALDADYEHPHKGAQVVLMTQAPLLLQLAAHLFHYVHKPLLPVLGDLAVRQVVEGVEYIVAQVHALVAVRIIEQLRADLQHYALLVVPPVEGMYRPGRYEKYCAGADGVCRKIDIVHAGPLLEPYYLIKAVKMLHIRFHSPALGEELGH